MANMFALILVIATLVTGILWCVDKFVFAPKRRRARLPRKRRREMRWITLRSIKWRLSRAGWRPGRRFSRFWRSF
ncbi:signal peptidase I [Salmonella enterica subsp. enterica]|uniref:Signal peptidase I n=1 Tax=Salmonella enterica I TaxID=59201 RepID=A0A379UVY6_SALET|nr:signal peptidase I [Salmonella enterica subsp. enterica]